MRESACAADILQHKRMHAVARRGRDGHYARARASSQASHNHHVGRRSCARDRPPVHHLFRGAGARRCVRKKREVALFGCDLPIALFTAVTAAHAYACRGNAVARAVVRDLCRERLFGALAGVMDLLCAAPERRLCLPRSTLLALLSHQVGMHAKISQRDRTMDSGKATSPGLPLYELCVSVLLEISGKYGDGILPTPVSLDCMRVKGHPASALTSHRLHVRPLGICICIGHGYGHGY
ncbi:hypothetical protein FOA52_014355 [Chlamydomonas sp. UWO 241]|nr:hypothetical protein FOA52_014355 [Chlamydomonas sp. UWO 241]